MSSEFVKVEKKDQVAFVQLAKEPVNSMNLDVWTALLNTLNDLENDPKIRAAVFSSGLKRDVFTAGNDINELYSKRTNSERYTQFWITSQTFLARLYNSRLFTIANVRGACPAGGCIFALACDIRIMIDNDNFRIGLNEVALGISVPRYWIQVMILAVGHVQAEKLLQTAYMPTPREAKSLGLIHHAVSPFDVEKTVNQELQTFLAFPDAGRIAVKQLMRSELSKAWIAYAPEEAKLGWAGLSSPKTTAALEKVLARLSGGDKKSKL